MPSLVLANIAATAKRVRLAPAVVVLPMHNPIGVAEEWATLDQLSGGRVEFAMGRGYDAAEYAPFGADFQRSADIFAEGIDLLWRCWTEKGPFSFSGEFYKADNIEICPKPVQDVLVPTIACFSRYSMEIAAARDWNIIFAPFATGLIFGGLAKATAAYREEAEKHGRAPGKAKCSYFIHIGGKPAEEQYGRECLLRYFNHSGMRQTKQDREHKMPPSMQYMKKIHEALAVMKPEESGRGVDPARLAAANHRLAEARRGGRDRRGDPLLQPRAEAAQPGDGADGPVHGRNRTRVCGHKDHRGSEVTTERIMDISINIAPTIDSWKVVKRAEELGYTTAWFYDTQMQNTDLFVAMTMAALNTSKIRLGTGVLIPSNRIAPVAATCLGSLSAIAPGRIDFGVSTGFTGRRAMGSGPIKLADMKEYIRVVQALLRNEMVEWEYEGRRRKIKYLNPEIGAINVTDSVPLHISAFGPRGQGLTAELGANWIFAPGNLQFAQGAIEKMKQSYRDAGQDPATKYITSLSGGCVLADGEPYDSPRAKAQAGPHAAMIFHNLVEAEEFGDIGRPVPPHLKSLLDRYREVYANYQPADARYISNHRGHLMFLRPEEQDIINGDIIKAATWTGTKPELVERMRALKQMGYSAYSVHIRNGHPGMLEDWADVFAAV